MKLNSIVLLAAGALALAGCSSAPKKVDSGKIQARTFSFVNLAGKPTPDFAEKRQPIHNMIQACITRTLANRGLARVDAGGDVTVSYLIIIGNNAATQLVNDYFGYGGDSAALHEKAHAAYTGSKNPNYFEAGTLLIDLVDSKSFKLLKRGYTTRPTLRDLPEDARAARIQEAVDEILRDVRIAQ